MQLWQDILSHQSKWSLDNAAEYRLSSEDAAILYRDAEFHALRKAAFLRRQKMNPGNKVTYLIDRNINYTNICTINCQFCSFYRPPGHDETYTQSFEEISQRISELEEVGGVRILMQGGVNPELSFDWYCKLLSKIKKKHPRILLDCFSPIEIDGISQVCGMSTFEVLKGLQEAGLDGLPGGGAEMLVDDIRMNVSPKKHGHREWMRIMQEAQSLGLTTSATNVFGFGESIEQRIEHLQFVRDSQDHSISQWNNGFTSFIAWPVQLENNSYGKRDAGRNKFLLGAGSIEYLRHVAVSRLFLDNFQHIQASWPTMGMEVAQMALFGGADDIGSTMMEENVVSASGTSKLAASEEELKWTIKRAGMIPASRDSRYRTLNVDVTTERELPCPPPVLT